MRALQEPATKEVSEREADVGAAEPDALLAPFAGGLSSHALHGGGIIALQRLVGNAAVAELVGSHERDRESGGGAQGPAAADAPGVEPSSDGGSASTPDAAGRPAAPAAGAERAAADAPAPVPATPAPSAGPAPPPSERGGAEAPAPAPAAPAPSAAPAPLPAERGPPAAAAGEPGDVREPHADPDFNAMRGATAAAGARSKAHQPAAAGAATAQGAAVAPANDASSQAAAAQVDEMGRQQPGVFDKKTFVAAVKKAIDANAPKNLEEADDFKGSGKAGKAKDEVRGLVKGGKQQSEKNIKQATEAQPDTGKAVPKQVRPMVNDETGAPAGDVGAGAAMPKPRPAAQTDLSRGPAQVEDEMTSAGVSEEQLAKSNEPQFVGALDARKSAQAHSERAPAEYRAQERELLHKGRADATSAAAEGLGTMHGARGRALGKALAHKGETKSADEARRAKVASEIQAIYDRTKADVTKILGDLDGKVDAAFSHGEQAARSKFEEYVGEQMRAYKDARYGGLLGKGRWLKDKLLGMPDEVNRFYERGKASYLQAMDGVIEQVADIVGRELSAARARIAQGRGEVQKYVAQLPADLRDIGKDAASKLEGEFDKLASDVDEKQSALVDTLASKYVEARDKLDARIDELKAANKGVVGRALDAIGGVIKTILALKAMLLNVLAKAADVIADIIRDPVGFLGRLVEGIKSGLNRFVANIGAHLQAGLMGWLFGALGRAGIAMPKKFDLEGILHLVLDILGLTWQNVRNRVVKAVGEPLMARMEGTVGVFKDFAARGIAGAWEWIKDKVSGVGDMILDQIRELVESRVVRAGITWLLSLLSPAGAFIKACKAIYDIVMFIVERGSQIMEFVDSILDSIGAIAKGSLGGVAERIESALAKALPLAISFLASLLGLGGISDKIRSILETVRAPINKAIDFVVVGAMKAFKKVFGAAIGWAKGKVEQGKAWVKGKVEAGKAWARGKVESGKRYVKDKIGAVLEWWRARAAFRGADGEQHSVYFRGSGASAVLTVASVPEPATSFLTRVRPLAQQSGPAAVEQHARATSKTVEIAQATADVESSERKPEKVDRLNELMIELANLLKPLVAVVPTPAASNLPVDIGTLVKRKGSKHIYVVTSIDDHHVVLTYARDEDDVSEVREPRAIFARKWDASEITLYDCEDQSLRWLYMGGTPSKRSSTGQRVRERMIKEGKLDDATDTIVPSRDPGGKPLPAGSKPDPVLIEDCDMGHIVDAVVWWNSNGRFAGVRAPTVRGFMLDPDNYEFEPTAINKARGRLRGRTERYLPPVR